MKRIVLLLAVFFPVCICFAQNGHAERTIKRIENKLFLVEDNNKYKIDETRVIAKLKSQRELPKDLCEKTQDLGFGIIEILVPDSMKVEDYLSLIEHTNDFEFVDFNTYGEYYLTPNDSLIGNQTGHQWYLDKIKTYDAWNITTGNTSIKVAVLDSGVDSCHYDLHYGIDNYSHLDIPNGYNYPSNTNYSSPLYFHGTMVAGIIGAKTNNNRGIAGVSGGNHSTGITIIPFNVGNYEPSTNYVINAINRAVEKGAKIINMSLGVAYNEGIVSAINAAYNQGTTIICATGNNFSSSIKFPASHSFTIAVGATNQSDQRAGFSNYGDGIDLVAPGVDIKSTYFYNSYYSASGTSFAAPQVAGVAALMLSVNPNLTPSQIRNKLRSTCTKLSGYSYTNGWNSQVGYGLLNAYAAVCSALSADNIVGPELVFTYGQYQIENLPSGVTVTWSLSNSNYNNYSHLISNFPALGWCLIFRDDNYDMKNDTLKAEIKYNNVTVQTLKKIVSAYNDFWGQYTSGNLSGEINYSHYFAIKTNTVTTVTSPNLYGATVTYDSSGATPTSWTFYPTYGTLYFTAPAGYVPVIINVHDGCGNDYVLYAYPAAFLYIINISYGDNGFTVTLEGSDPERESNEDLPWTVEVRSATTGQLMASQSSTSRSETISTAGWPKGIYIVKVTVGKEVLTEKVVVK